VGPRAGLVHCGEEKILLPPDGNRTPAVQPIVRGCAGLAIPSHPKSVRRMEKVHWTEYMFLFSLYNFSSIHSSLR
jgi:hypothetical protein